MHPRNRYRNNPVDFGELAEFRPSLKPFLISKYKTEITTGLSSPPLASQSISSNSLLPKKSKFPYTLDFSDPASLRELTCAVLERDFGIKLEIPLDKLIPTVPQKLNYIHWIEDLLCCGGVVCQDEGVAGEGSIPKGKMVFGIDIGTGPACIYPLLGSHLNGWSFIATDVTMDTVQCATKNVSRNNFQDHIQVKLVPEDTMLKNAIETSVSQHSFTMCNPPFFKNKKDKFGDLTSHSSKRPAPSTFSSGAEVETITEGGEVGFVERIIEDSLELRERIRWYTSMLGKKASLKVLVSKLKSHQVPVMTTTEFVQGKTWRWGIAWSFDPSLKSEVEQMKRNTRKRTQSHKTLQLIVQGAEGTVPHPSPTGMQQVRQWLEEQLQELEINSTVESCDTAETCHWRSVLCTAHKITWSHQRKKRRLLDRLTRQSTEDMDNELHKKIKAEIDALCSPCALEFTCCIKLEKISDINFAKRKKKAFLESSGEGREGDEVVSLEFQWIKGDKDLLDQIMQYLQNKLVSKHFLQ